MVWKYIFSACFIYETMSKWFISNILPCLFNASSLQWRLMLFLVLGRIAVCWEGPTSGDLAFIYIDGWTFCIQCGKSLHVLSGRASVKCFRQGLGEKQAYTWMHKPHHQWRITLQTAYLLWKESGRLWYTSLHQNSHARLLYGLV